MKLTWDAAGGQADSKEARSEARLRLLAGLKRYFHSKRAEGLLSGTVRPLLHTSLQPPTRLYPDTPQ